MDKDKAIITQVCAKIAADLTDKTKEMDARLSEYAVLFSTIKDIVFDEIFGDTSAAQETTTNNVVQMVQSAFAGTEVISSGATTSAVSIKGTTHGPIPEWLIKACKRDGVTEVWDNRDGLAENPKRPSFRATTGEKSYWPPRGK
jgi:hypothetical protein